MWVRLQRAPGTHDAASLRGDLQSRGDQAEVSQGDSKLELEGGDREARGGTEPSSRWWRLGPLQAHPSQARLHKASDPALLSKAVLPANLHQVRYIFCQVDPLSSSDHHWRGPRLNTGHGPDETAFLTCMII